MPVKQKTAKLPDPDARFRYIGFEVYPGRVNGIFKSEEEHKKYLEQVKQESPGESVKEHSLVHQKIYSVADKILLIAISLLLLISLFLPWVRLNLKTNPVQYNGLVAIGKVFGAVGTAGNINLSISLILAGIFIILVPIFSLTNLVVLFSGSKVEQHFIVKLKRLLLFHWVPIILWLVIIIGALIGSALPSAWTAAVGAINYNSMVLFSTIGYGGWIAFSAFLIMAIKAAEL